MKNTLQIEQHNKPLLMMFGFIFFLALIALPDTAYAASSQGGGLPYEGWLTKLRECEQHDDHFLWSRCRAC